MPITKKKKQELLNFLKEESNQQKSIIFLTNKDSKQSLNAEKNANLRKRANEKGLALKMVKINLLQKTFKDFPKDLKNGQVYVAFSLSKENIDEVTVPKGLVDFIKKDFDDNLSILGGYMGEKFLNSETAKILASTPSFDESMSMVASSMNSLATNVARLIKEIPTQIARGTSLIT
jgi:ribosomal protein L10